MPVFIAYTEIKGVMYCSDCTFAIAFLENFLTAIDKINFEN